MVHVIRRHEDMPAACIAFTARFKKPWFGSAGEPLTFGRAKGGSPSLGRAKIVDSPAQSV